jgi:hypothetical protein
MGRSPIRLLTGYRFPLTERKQCRIGTQIAQYQLGAFWEITMTHEQRLFKVMSAVRDCLQTCGRSPAPKEALGYYVDRLRKDPCWNDSEVQEVKSTAEKAIAAGQRRSATNHDHPGPPQPFKK